MDKYQKISLIFSSVPFASLIMILITTRGFQWLGPVQIGDYSRRGMLFFNPHPQFENIATFFYPILLLSLIISIIANIILIYKSKKNNVSAKMQTMLLTIQAIVILLILFFQVSINRTSVLF